MKNISLLLAFCFSFLAFSQAQVPPQAFNHSAVARNAAGQPISSNYSCLDFHTQNHCYRTCGIQ